jgi:hypothetical protein
VHRGARLRAPPLRRGWGPPTKGGVFDIGMGQGGGGPGATDLSLYKSQLEGWLEDGAFWEDMSRYVRD